MFWPVLLLTFHTAVSNEITRGAVLQFNVAIFFDAAAGTVQHDFFFIGLSIIFAHFRCSLRRLRG